MTQSVELSVKSQLESLISDLDGLNSKAREISNTMAQSGRDVGESYQKQIKQTEGFLANIRNVSRRLADQIRSDFKSLVSINALQESLKLSNQFRGSIDQAITLGDTIRKLGSTFGIANEERAKFHSDMMKSMGQIGLSSEAANNSLQGLTDTPVRGRDALIEYSKTAGQLASITGSQGQEGKLAGGVARVIQARGGNVNDLSQIRSVMEDVRRAFVATGKSPADILGGMERIFAGMSSDMRKTIGTEGLAKIAAAGQVAGPGSTKFLEEFMGKSAIQRKALEAQGFGGVVTAKGIDTEKFRKAAQEVLQRVGGDPRMAAKTLGLTDEAAEGFIRLTENLDRVKKAQDAMTNSTGSLNEQYRQSMGLGESFRANINKVKGVISGPLSKLQDMATSGLSKASETTGGAAGVVLGGGLLAAILAGTALKGIGKGLGVGGFAKAKGMEALTGEKVQNVYVVNASEMGKGLTDTLSMGSKMGGVGGMLGKAGLVATAGMAGYQVGQVINEKIIEKTGGKTSEGFEGNVVERLFFKLDKLFGGETSSQFMKAQKVMLELKSPELSVKKEQSRGVSFK